MGVFQLSDHVVCRQTSSDLRMLFDRQKGVMYELNETASAIVERLSGGPASIEALTESLCGEFEGPEHEIREDVENMLADFADAGLVQEGSSA